MSIDEKDKKILSELMQNSRQSYREIAKKVELSTATVMHRVDELEKNGIIKKYTAHVDYEKLGFDVQVLIDLRVSKGKLFEVEKKIAKHPNISAVYDTTGEFDVTLVAKFKNRRAMDSFLKTIQTYEFVERTNTKLILNIIKESGVQI
ncbi:MAG: Lrp/AsnC family transcriptional regulator [bacterium]